MISAGHFASETIRKRLDELHRLWELLLSRLAEKGMKLQQALVLVQFLRHCDEVMFWIHDKVCFDEYCVLEIYYRCCCITVIMHVHVTNTKVMG